MRLTIGTDFPLEVSQRARLWRRLAEAGQGVATCYSVDGDHCTSDFSQSGLASVALLPA